MLNDEGEKAVKEAMKEEQEEGEEEEEEEATAREDRTLPLQQPDPLSLATLRLFNAYRWSVQEGAGASSEGDQYRVRWEGHAAHLAQQVARLEHEDASSDVTVATKGTSIPAHRVVLAAASSFFCSLLQDIPSGQHPVIVVKGADPRHLRYLVTFCYSGAVSIPSQDVTQVLELAEELEISGLRVSAGAGGEVGRVPSPARSHTFSALRQHLFRPSPPNRFTYTPPLNVPSPPAPNPTAGSPPGKRPAEPTLSLQDTQRMKKRCTVEPLPARLLAGGEGDLRLSPRPVPPGSAPPHLAPRPSSSSPHHFFPRGPPSPPNSAPPQPALDLSAHAHHANQMRDKSLLGHTASPSNLLPSWPPRPPSAPPSNLHANVKEELVHGGSSSSTPPATPKEPSTPSTPSTPTSFNMEVGRGLHAGSRVLLWRFLLDLLHDPLYSPVYIRWLDRPKGVFRIMESDMVAQLWGMARKNNNMNYEKMSRGMRTYYKRGILSHIDGTKLIYQFNTQEREIQERMRFHELTKRVGAGTDDSTTTALRDPSASASSHQAGGSKSSATPPSLASSVGAGGGAGAGGDASPYSSTASLFDFPTLPPSLLYDHYLWLRASSQRELY